MRQLLFLWYVQKATPEGLQEKILLSWLSPIQQLHEHGVLQKDQMGFKVVKFESRLSFPFPNTNFPLDIPWKHLHGISGLWEWMQRASAKCWMPPLSAGGYPNYIYLTEYVLYDSLLHFSRVCDGMRLGMVCQTEDLFLIWRMAFLRSVQVVW